MFSFHQIALVVAGLWVTALSAQTAPVFTAAPAPRQVVALGENLPLTVAVTGSPAPVITWAHNGLALPGATGPSLILTAATMRDAGWYRATATNSAGTATSAVIFVNVTVPRPDLIVRRPSNPFETPSPSELAALLAVPSGLTHVSDIAAGSQHALALRGDGTVVAWGAATPLSAREVPAGLTEVVALSAGTDFSLALRADGRVVAWGANDSNQATPPPDLTNAVAIAAGRSHALALRADGRVVAWGYALSGATVVPPTLTDAVAIAAGTGFSLALRANGTVVSWGGSSERTVPATLSGVIAIAAGTGFGVALKSDGTVIDWMSSDDLNLGRITNRPSDPITGIVAISAAGTCCAALRADGTVIDWINEVNFGGAVNPSIVPGFELGLPPPTLTNVVSAAAGQGFTLVMRDTSSDTLPVIVEQPVGQITTEAGDSAWRLTVRATGSPTFTYQWLRDDVPIPGQTASELHLLPYSNYTGTYTVVVANNRGTTTSAPATYLVLAKPILTTTAPARQRVELGLSLKLSVSVSSNDPVRLQWTRNGLPIPGATRADYVIPQATTRDTGPYQVIATNSAGTTRSAAMFVNVAVPNARLIAWGDPDRIKTLPASLADVVAVAPSSTGSYVLHGDGTVSAWGAEAPPADLRDIVAISAGASYALALKSDGSLVAWGTPGASPPTTEKNVVAIKVSGNRVTSDRITAIREDGSVVGVGTLPTDLGPIAAVALPRSEALALRSDGTLIAISIIQEVSIRSSPVNVRSVAAGTGHYAALTGDGAVILWGNNGDGQTTAPSGLTDVVSLDAAANYTVALRIDGTVLAWGDATGGLTSVPKGVARAVSIAAGQKHCIALLDTSAETAPVIINQPESQAIAAGGTATFTATLAGTGSGATYQWLFNGNPLPGATASTLTLAALTPTAAGRYAVRITNSLGAVTSASAPLTVDTTQNPGRLINLSVRATAGSGARTLIVGATISGNSPAASPKPLLIRAVGPSLQPFGVSGFLTDPLLRIYSGSTVIANNDNWGGDAQIARISKNVGAFALSTTYSRDAAMAAQLGSGGYTIQITGFDNGNGIALAEIYDAATAGTVTPLSPKLLNISARAQVNTGGEILIAGFVIEGTTNKTVLIRAIGPTLGTLGVTDVLSDPKLELFNNSTPIGTNDNWGGSAEITAASARVGAFALKIDSKDAALLVSLPPGSYSAQVSGSGGQTGVALVEVYDVP